LRPVDVVVVQADRFADTQAGCGQQAEQRAVGRRTQRLHERVHIRDRIAQAIVNGTECGEVPAGTAETVEAAGLLACVDGLALHLYNDPEAISPGAAGDALAHHLRRIFPGECNQRNPGTGDIPGR
jgi:hypothetical protein